MGLLSVPVEIDGAVTLFATGATPVLQLGGWVDTAGPHCRVAVQLQHSLVWPPLLPVRWLVQWLIVGLEIYFPFFRSRLPYLASN